MRERARTVGAALTAQNSGSQRAEIDQRGRAKESAAPSHFQRACALSSPVAILLMATDNRLVLAMPVLLIWMGRGRKRARRNDRARACFCPRIDPGGFADWAGSFPKDWIVPAYGAVTGYG